jgi:hypothetical protein
MEIIKKKLSEVLTHCDWGEHLYLFVNYLDLRGTNLYSILKMKSYMLIIIKCTLVEYLVILLKYLIV